MGFFSLVTIDIVTDLFLLRLSQKGAKLQNINNFVMSYPDPASPGSINGWRSRIKCGMTTFLDNFGSNPATSADLLRSYGFFVMYKEDYQKYYQHF